MRGTDWLRRKAAGAVRIEEARPAEVTLTIDNRDSRFTTPSNGYVPLLSNEQQLAEQQRTKAAADRASYCQQRGWLDCACVVIYSRCYYGH